MTALLRDPAPGRLVEAVAGIDWSVAAARVLGFVAGWTVVMLIVGLVYAADEHVQVTERGGAM